MLKEQDHICTWPCCLSQINCLLLLLRRKWYKVNNDNPPKNINPRIAGVARAYVISGNVLNSKLCSDCGNTGKTTTQNV